MAKAFYFIVFTVISIFSLGQKSNPDSTLTDDVYLKSKEYKYYKRAYKAESRGRYRKAAKFYSRAITESHKKYSPLRADYYESRGKMYSNLWKRKKALNDFLVAISYDSTNESIISTLAREYYYVLEYEKAIKYFNKLSKTKDSSYNLPYAINSYHHLKEYDSAISLSKIFLEKNKDSIAYSSFISDTYFEIFDYKTAIQLFEKEKEHPIYEDGWESSTELNKKLAISYTQLAIDEFKRNNDTCEFIRTLYQATLNHEPSFLDDEELRQLARFLLSIKKWDYSYYYYYYIKKHTLSDYKDLCKIGTKIIIEEDKLIKRSCKKVRKRRKQFRYEK